MTRHGAIVRGGATPRVVSAPAVRDDATDRAVDQPRLQGHRPPRRLAGALAAAVMLLIGARIAQVPEPATALAAPTRGELAQTARLEGQAAAYEEYRSRRSERADAARWTAQATFHTRLRQAAQATAPRVGTGCLLRQSPTTSRNAITTTPPGASAEPRWLDHHEQVAWRRLAAVGARAAVRARGPACSANRG